MNRAQLAKQIHEKRSYLCIGLDTNVQKIPAHLRQGNDAVFEFNKAIIDATKDACVSYKINTAFYESQGVTGWEAMEKTLHYIPETHLKIADAKRGDIGNTSSQYAKAFFETLPFDAVTVAPYMGEDSVRPFLEYENKFTIVLGLTSNKGSEDFQKLSISKQADEFAPRPHIQQASRQRLLYEEVIQKIGQWGTPDNLMFVIGATQAKELDHVRSLLPDHFLLIPGVGFQGGSLKEVSEHGMNKEVGLLVNVSRAIIYAGEGENFANEAAIIAKQYQTEMSSYLNF